MTEAKYTTTPSKHMKKFLDGMDYSQFKRYQTKYERENNIPAAKCDNYQMWKKLVKAMKWKNLKNLQLVVEYLGMDTMDSESVGFDVDHALTNISGCRALIKIQKDYYREQYEEKGY